MNNTKLDNVWLDDMMEEAKQRILEQVVGKAYTRNHMKDVAKMLGVELGEEFKIACKEGTCYEGGYYLSEQGLVCAEGWYCKPILSGLITGGYEIKKTPWIPKHGEEYCFINTTRYTTNACLADIDCKKYCGDNYDILNLLTKNHFKTEDRAVEARESMMEKFEKILKGELKI